ncbi:transcriptional regulator, MarR family [Actinobacteria bacterium OK074]|nr:transcriptional regulator, MarR family [Actinobacteria bacterium OK074]
MADSLTPPDAPERDDAFGMPGTGTATGTGIGTGIGTATGTGIGTTAEAAAATTESTEATESAQPADAEPSLLPPQLRAWMGLLAAAGAIEQQLRTRVKETIGISHDEFLVLCLLADGPGCGMRMTQIAERLGRPKTRLTYQVACLQHAGLITRTAAPGDRRGIQVALTAKARSRLREASALLAAAVTDAVKDLEDGGDCSVMSSLLTPSPTAGNAAADRNG